MGKSATVHNCPIDFGNGAVHTSRNGEHSIEWLLCAAGSDELSGRQEVPYVHDNPLLLI